MQQKILVWDVPTRVFHWLLVLTFAADFWTADSERTRDIHVILGYIFLGLLVFRLLWGVVGTRYARFGSFLFGPGAVIAYVKSLLRRNPAHYVGHNPAGSVAIWLLLLSGMISGVSGVLALKDIGGDTVVELHDMVSEGMLAIIAIHILGVVSSSLMHRENLVRSMVTGFKSGQSGAGIDRSYWWLGLLMICIALAFGFGYTPKG
jgi:cytochrome b